MTEKQKIANRLRAAEWYFKNKDRKKIYDVEYNKKNRTKKNLWCLEWIRKNKDKRLAIRKASYHKNKNRAFANAAARRARLLNAMPKWLTKEQRKQISDIYANRPEGYHVDHIEPLKGKDRSGLHVPWNLQYLKAEDNFRKGNKCG
jgi:hypothetical protein